MTDLVHQVDLVWLWEGTPPKTVEETEADVSLRLANAALLDQPITAEVVDISGRIPVVRFRTPHWGTMLRLLFEYYGKDLQAAIDSYDEKVKITL